jgi:hypothetical protein
MSSAPILPAALTQILDQAIQFVYSLEPLVAPTVVLGTLRGNVLALLVRARTVYGRPRRARVDNARYREQYRLSVRDVYPMDRILHTLRLFHRYESIRRRCCLVVMSQCRALCAVK